jgi:hypothetical protein
MPSILDPTNAFFTWLWRTSCQASVLILLVLLAQWLLRKQLTPTWRHGLWLLVVLRMVVVDNEQPRNPLRRNSPPFSIQAAPGNPVLER